MHLKSMTIQGFKSFPDKINIDFTDGLTAIVGPNGSGKSNISDAIRWVLGEMSAKSLRGAKMEDVIFNGTEKRKPCGFAEVSLTLENDDKRLNYDFNEVTVTRRYYRSGESEYFINRQPVRLRDINELFMDTGLGRDGYSMIGQGKISEILSTKSEDRRQIFEEAAGISKFRYRKQEAEKKLSAAEENLIRLNDILAELQERVGPLKEQSEKAKRYLILRDEKKVLDINVWLEQLDKTALEVKAAEEKIRIAAADLESANLNLENLNKSINTAFDKTASINISIEELLHEIEEKNAGLIKAQSEIDNLKAASERNLETVERLWEDLSGNNTKIEGVKSQIRDKNETVAVLEEKAEQVNAEMSQIISRSDELVKRDADTAEKTEDLTQKYTQLNSAITQLMIKESTVRANMENLESDSDNSRTELSALQAQYTEKESKLSACSEEIEAQNVKKQSLLNILAGWKLKSDNLTKKAEESEKAYASCESVLTAKKQRLEMLRDMEKNHEGFFQSVKECMDKSRKGVLKGIISTVADAVQTDEKYALALETLMGNSLQSIITEDEESAKAAVNFLKSNNLGRSTFLPLTAVKGAVLNSDEFKSSAGFIGVASELISYDSKILNAVNFLLGRCAVVDNISNAVALARSYGYKFRIVTLDGQLINAGGSITGGSSVKKVGVFSRANEIKKLEAEIGELSKKFMTAKQAMTEAVAAASEIRAKESGAMAEVKAADDELIRLNAEHGHIKSIAEAAKTALESYELMMNSREKQLNALKEQMAAIADELKSKRLTAADYENDLKSLSESSAASRQEKDKLFEDINTKKLEIVNITKDIEAEKRMIAELEKQLEEQSQSTEQKRLQIESVKEENERIAVQIQTLTEQTEQFRMDAAEKNALVDKYRTERDENDKNVTRMRQEEKDFSEKVTKMSSELARLETKKESVAADYDGIINRLWDEYEMTVTEAESLRSEIESVAKAVKRINEIKREIKAMGDVNVGAIEEYAEVADRYETMTAQCGDLVESKTELEKIISELTAEMKRIFADQFTVINRHFSNVFKELFGGGSAELVLSEPGDILNSGIDFRVAPPGKVIKNIEALSGGERALVAIALYFAILQVRPAPFCVLDEIEAALDDVNVVRFAEYLKRVNRETQFITITHRRGTMEVADVLYGVTMQENGVSKMLVINVSEMEKEFLS